MALELQIEFKEGRHLWIVPGHVPVAQLSADGVECAQHLLNARILSTVCLNGGYSERGTYFWFRNLVSTCKAMTGGNLTNLFAYMQNTPMKSLQDIATHLISGAGDGPVHANIPAYALTTEDEKHKKGQIPTDAVRLAEHHELPTREQLVAAGKIALSRAVQFASLGREAIRIRRHQARFVVSR